MLSETHGTVEDDLTIDYWLYCYVLHTNCTRGLGTRPQEILDPLALGLQISKGNI